MKLSYKDDSSERWWIKEPLKKVATDDTEFVLTMPFDSPALGRSVKAVVLPARICKDFKPEYRDYNYYINYCRMLDITPLPYTTKKDVKLNFGEWCDESNKWLKHFKMLLILNK